VREFLYVRASHGTQLVLTGSGRVHVTSPPTFRPRQSYAIRIGRRSHLRRADGQGRLRFRVDLGPSHTQQQTSFTTESTAGWRTIKARILRVRKRAAAG
jgi:hypothetical protein